MSYVVYFLTDNLVMTLDFHISVFVSFLRESQCHDEPKSRRVNSIIIWQH